ncbi:hypothetical protein CBR_g12375 [Chara braunii]|uniref:Uncharacterized protein n=1 Tax=Chara braunii TaxID=69332 RepID=A0A388KS34_CHABU|nr:hypothetical protein CBR_g12375 [Chara braunii]|eukprot:GBG72808.1 hypothetical protein CBR_g12375 [Chara braunii]
MEMKSCNFGSTELQRVKVVRHANGDKGKGCDVGSTELQRVMVVRHANGDKGKGVRRRENGTPEGYGF